MRIWMAAALAAIVLAGGAAAEEDWAVRVLTYNTHHCEGTDGKLDVPRIAAVIRAAQADVVCLQEIDRHQARSGRVDQAQEIAELLDMAVVFASNYDFGGGGYGNALLTRFEILGHENARLANPHDVEPRGALRVHLRAGGFDFDVINTHLGLKPDERAAQAEGLLAHVRPGVPTILAGDLNEDERAPGVGRLLTRFQSVHPHFGVENQYTSSSQHPRRRIDFVLYTEPFVVDNAEVIRDPPVAVASDHLPVLAVFRVPRPAESTPINAKE